MSSTPPKDQVSLFPIDLNEAYDPTLFVEQVVEPESFRNRFLKLLALTVSIPLILMLFLHYQFLQESTQRTNQRQQEITRTVANVLDEKLSSLRLRASLLARALEASDAQQNTVMASMVQAGLELSHFADGAIVLDSNTGHPLFSTGNIRTLPDRMTVDDPASGVDEDGGFFIGASGPEHVRTVLFRVAGPRLSQLVEQQAQAADLDFFVTDATGRILFGSDSSRTHIAPIVHPNGDTTHPVVTPGTRDRARLQSETELKTVNWRLVVESSLLERDIALRGSFTTSGMIVLLGLAFSVLTALWASRPMLRSFEDLRMAVESFKRGRQVEVSERIRKNGPIELFRFAQRFEAIANENREQSLRLRELYAGLEQKVAERTDALKRKNAELSALQKLLTPNGGAGREDINRVVERIRRIYHIPQLFFSKTARTGEDLHSLPIGDASTLYGYIVLQHPGELNEEILAPIRRLINAVGIVLANRVLLENLSKEQTTLQAVFDSVNEGVALLRADGTPAYVNQRLSSMLDDADVTHHPVTDLLSRRFSTLLDLKTERRSDLALCDILRLETNRTYRLLEADGGRVYEIVLFAVKGGKLEREGIERGILVRDKTADLALSRFKNQLISVVAHELKTPITSLRLQAETLAKAPDLPSEEKQEILSGMQEESIRLRQMIDDWLDLARFDDGMLQLDRRVVHIATPIDKASRIVRTRFPITVERHIEPDAECFMFDAGRMTQVFINLFSNAARYAKIGEDPQVQVAVRRVENDVEIRVLDHGIGIDEGNLPRIFERFYQIDMRDDRPRSGSGLGLAIVKAIIEAHGGDIRVESRRDIFTCFVIRLPYQ